MSNTQKESVSYIVSNEILNQKGRFTIQDILEHLKSKLDSLFEDVKIMLAYIQDKINSLCELGLVGSTEIYYYVD